MVLLATLAAGALACLGRWPSARILSALILVPPLAQVHASLWLIPLLTLVALMPGATGPARTDRHLAVAFAVLTCLPTLATATVGETTASLGMIGLLPPVLVILALRAAAPDGRLLHVLAIAVASLPWSGAPAASPIGLALVTLALAAAWGAGRTLRTRRRATA
ncbi:hypothetical protein [Streptomyces sp. NPDC016845]|uniref:hypothetical protein n=1 Tax=Streptomyces sp. NPDC016845 TaxID=3364972 RepID=UPI003794E772